MTNDTQKKMPMEKLIAYRVAKDVLARVVALEIREPQLRDQAIRAAQSCCLNIAEAQGRWSGPDRTRMYRIARGECCELCAALEIAQISRRTSGSCDGALAGTGRLYALQTGLSRR